MTDTKAAAASLEALGEELVPLEVASSIAYLATARRRVDDHGRLPEMLHLAAIALSQVAPIHRRSDDGQVAELSAVEVNATLFGPVREGRAPRLDGYVVRRDDLRKALVTMREARRAFDQSTPVKLRTAAALLHHQLTGAARDSMKGIDYFNALGLAASQLAQVVDIYYSQGRRLVRLTQAELASGRFVDGGNVFRTASGALYRGLVAQRAEVLKAVDMLAEAQDVLRRMRAS